MSRWAISLLALGAALATCAPHFATALERSRAVGAYELLAAIDTGIDAFALTVHTGNPPTAQLPGRVSQLSMPITAASMNSCGAAMNGSAAARWAQAGPFIDFAADSSGFETPVGRIQDAIERSPQTEDNALIVRMPGVSSAVAGMLDAIVDNGDGGAAGKVRFAAAVSDTTSVRYRVVPRQHNKC